MTLPPPTPLKDAEIENLANQPRAYALTNAKVLATITSLTSDLQRTRDALSDIANTYDNSWREGSQERMIGDKARAILTPPTGEPK